MQKAIEHRSSASYLELVCSGELHRLAEEAAAGMAACRQCGWACGVNRLAGETGHCRTGLQAFVSSYGPHLGEEDPLRGWRGSGTVFFARCNLQCSYCQNAEISRSTAGVVATTEALAAIFLELQSLGCHNINLVSPTHVVAQILAALEIAVSHGLYLPLVYNTGGYDSIETLRWLDGVVDIYLPDMKYADAAVAQQYSAVADYPAINQAAVIEMHRQVGDLFINQDGIATSGLLVRHLVLPGRLAGSKEIIRFLAERVSTNTYLNLMEQYRPAPAVASDKLLSRPVNRQEYMEAVEWAHAAGLHRLDQRRSRF